MSNIGGDNYYDLALEILRGLETESMKVCSDIKKHFEDAGLLKVGVDDRRVMKIICHVVNAEKDKLFDQTANFKFQNYHIKMILNELSKCILKQDQVQKQNFKKIEDLENNIREFHKLEKQNNDLKKLVDILQTRLAIEVNSNSPRPSWGNQDFNG